MEELTLASRTQRFVGAVVDALVALVLSSPLVVVFMATDGAPTAGQGATMFLYSLAAFAVVNGWLLAKHGQTVGKKVARTRIVGLDGNLRPFAVVLLIRYALVWAIGYLLPLFGLVDALFIFRKDRRCIHDLLARTQVIQADSTAG